MPRFEVSLFPEITSPARAISPPRVIPWWSFVALKVETSMAQSSNVGGAQPLQADGYRGRVTCLKRGRLALYFAPCRSGSLRLEVFPDMAVNPFEMLAHLRHRRLNIAVAQESNQSEAGGDKCLL